MNKPGIEVVAPAPERDHAFTQEQLPWAVTGVLDESVRRRVQAHVATCGQCRSELAQHERIAAAMQASPVVELAPQPGLAKLLAKIEARETRRARWLRWLGPLSGERAQRPLVFTVAIQAAVIVMLTGTLAAVLLRSPASAPYRTLSNSPAGATSAAAAPAPAAQLRVLLDAQLTLAQIEALLEPLHARIVDGPRATNAGSLVTLGIEGDPQAALAVLRQQAGVQFAELVWN